MYKVHMLPALFGDSLLIEYGSKTTSRYILIDGGPYYGFKEMSDALKKVAPKLRQLELLVITHIDIDHIDGTITLLNQDKLPFKIKEIWFNGWNQLKYLKTGLLGPLQGEYISILINKNKIKHNSSFGGKAVMVKNPGSLPEITLAGGMKLTLLSPHLEALKKLKDTWKKEIDKIKKVESIQARWKKEKRYPPGILGGTPPHPDNSVANASSIAFIAEYKKTSCLFAGDTMSAELLKSIEPLCKKMKKDRMPVSAWKLAHHGSQKSTLPSIIQKIKTYKMLISTNGDRYKHPDSRCIEALCANNPKGINLYFNYRSQYNNAWDKETKKKEYGHKAFYPTGKDGISVVLG